MLHKGGGSNRLPGLVAKQQAVKFPQVQTSFEIMMLEGVASAWLGGFRILTIQSVHYASTCIMRPRGNVSWLLEGGG